LAPFFDKVYECLAYSLSPLIDVRRQHTAVRTSPAAAPETMILSFAEATRHEEAVIHQPALQERADDSFQIAAYERQDQDSRADQRVLKSVGDGAAYQHFNAGRRHLSGPSEGIPGFQQYRRPPNLGTITRLDHAQSIGHIKDG